MRGRRALRALRAQQPSMLLAFVFVAWASDGASDGVVVLLANAAMAICKSGRALGPCSSAAAVSLTRPTR
eukprot:7843435-Pyramimonas_sp.AAC.1